MRFSSRVIYVCVLTEIRWLYMLLLAIDTNFRLKCKERGVKDDPELGGAWGQFVDGEMYEAELGKHHGDIEVRFVFVGSYGCEFNGIN